MDEILRLFPEAIRMAIKRKVRDRWRLLQEIRFRVERPIELIFDHRTEWVDIIKPDRDDGIFILNQLSQHSLYRMEDELREGYITIEGGHRVGLAGKVNTQNGSVKAIKHIAFLNIRIAKQIIGAGTKVLPHMYKDGGYLNTLFIGPPQTGKTTLIRDLVRLIANGWENVAAKKVAVIDERSEIGGSIKGIPQHDLGKRADVMDACPKAEGMMMMIRSMSPEVLVVDEIGGEKDVQALMEAINAGVSVICSIHGQSLEELEKRPSLQSVFSQHVFQRMILLDKHGAPGKIRTIYSPYDATISEKSG